MTKQPEYITPLVAKRALIRLGERDQQILRQQAAHIARGTGLSYQDALVVLAAVAAAVVRGYDETTG